MTSPTPAADTFAARAVHLTRADLRAYAEASGDHNPIHLDDDAARALGLPGVIAHGMLSWARVLSEVAVWAGGMDRIHSSVVRFARPVVVPAEGAACLEITGRVRPVDPGTGRRTVVLTVTCDGVKVFGKALVEVQERGDVERDVTKK